jgi:hypothetical protein
MTKILFIMFNGAGANTNSWNKDTESKFLDKLKKIGKVYTYQDKVNNICYYNKSDSDYASYDSDINFDFKYININNHVKIVYNDIIKKYRNISNYKLIPIGWSIGGLLALYFAQKYKSKCAHIILLDPTVFTPKNIKLRLKNINSTGINKSSISNEQFKKMLKRLKNKDIKIIGDDVRELGDIIIYKRLMFISKHLKLTLPVPTTSFVNMQDADGLEWKKIKTREIKTLKAYNPTKFKTVVFINKGHHVFNKIKPAKKIIKHINALAKIITK